MLKVTEGQLGALWIGWKSASTAAEVLKRIIGEHLRTGPSR